MNNRVVAFIPPREGRGVQVCQPLAQQDGLAGEPWPSAYKAWGVRESPECGSTACAELYPWQEGMGCFLASSKAPPHQGLYAGNGKGLHSTHSACFSLGYSGAPISGQVWGQILFLCSSGPKHVLEQVMQQQTLLLLISCPGAAGNSLHILTSSDFCLVFRDSAGEPWPVASRTLVLFPKCWAGGRNGQRLGSALGAAPVRYTPSPGALHLSA